MIKNIIFDFGDIFINLDKKHFAKELQNLGINQDDATIIRVLNDYEMGLISTKEFLYYFEEKLEIPSAILKKAWNSILRDFPEHRLQFIQKLASEKKYRLFLLSNTNDLHISWIQERWGIDLYNKFKNCFEAFYLTNEINFRKPNLDIYQFVLKKHNLKATETLFIDDTKENTEAAKSIGLKVWNLTPGKEDVTQLFTTKKHLF